MKKYLLFFLILESFLGCKSQNEKVAQSAEQFLADVAAQKDSLNPLLSLIGANNLRDLEKIKVASVRPIVFIDFKTLKTSSVAHLNDVVNFDMAKDYLVTYSKANIDVAEWFFNLGSTTNTTLSARATAVAGGVCSVLYPDAPLYVDLPIDERGTMGHLPIGEDTGMIMVDMGDVSERFLVLKHLGANYLIPIHNLFETDKGFLLSKNRPYAIAEFQNIIEKLIL